MVKQSPRKNPCPKKILPFLWCENDDGEKETTAINEEPLNAVERGTNSTQNGASDVLASQHEMTTTPSKPSQGSSDEQNVQNEVVAQSNDAITLTSDYNDKETKSAAENGDQPSGHSLTSKAKMPQKKTVKSNGPKKTSKKDANRLETEIKRISTTYSKSVKAKTESQKSKIGKVKKDANQKSKFSETKGIHNMKSSKEKLGSRVAPVIGQSRAAESDINETNQKKTVAEEDACIVPHKKLVNVEQSPGDAEWDLCHESGNPFRGRTSDEIIVAESMLLINTRELTETLSALNKDSAGLSTPLHNSAIEKRINSFLKTPSKTPVKRTAREFLTPDRLAERTIRAASVAFSTPAKPPASETTTPQRTRLSSSPKSIMKDRSSVDDKTPSPRQKSPHVHVHFANLPAKHRTTSIPRTQKLRETAAENDAKSPGKRKRGSEEEQASLKKRKILASPSPSKHKVKRRLKLDPSESYGAIECCTEETLHLKLELPNAAEESDGGVEETDSCHSESENELKIVEGDLPLDEAIESTIADQHFLLNANNVKSLIRNIITDEAVMDMVRNTIQEEGIEEQLKEAIFVPKMTRARVKQVIESSGQLPGWPISPMKTPVKVASATKNAFINMTFSDEEEDEDYDPAKDNESGDDESVVSSQASEPASPVEVMSLDFSAFDASTSVLASEDEFSANDGAKDTETVDGAYDTETDHEDLETIALRTRSKVPLKNTSVYDLEANFAAPDITPDMYDTFCDDQEWTNFLTCLIKDDMNETFEDDNDPEYNVMDELEEEDDKENYRDDRAVRVSKKEVNLLIDELMDAFGEEDIEEHVSSPVIEKKKDKVRFNIENKKEGDQLAKKRDPPTASKIPVGVKSLLKEASKDSEPLPITEDAKVPMFSSSERSQLEVQMRKHVQLLTQTKILSTSNAEFKQYGEDAKGLLQELGKFGDGSIIVEGCVSAFHPCNLKNGEELMKWKHPPPDHEMVGSIHSAMRSIFRNTGFSTTLQCPTWEQMEVFLNHPAFIYGQILPSSSFLPSHKLAKQKNFFTPAEDNLITMGLEQFSQVSQKLNETVEFIHKHHVPGHHPDRILKRVKQMQLVRAPDNPIKSYRKDGKLPKWPRFPMPDNDMQVVLPKDQDPDQLPPWFKGVLKVAELVSVKEKENQQSEVLKNYIELSSKKQKKKRTSIAILGLKGGTKNYDSKKADTQRPLANSSQHNVNISEANSENNTSAVVMTPSSSASVVGSSTATPVPSTPRTQTSKHLATSTPVHSSAQIANLSTSSHGTPGHHSTIIIPSMNSPMTPCTSMPGTPLGHPETPGTPIVSVPGTPLNPHFETPGAESPVIRPDSAFSSSVKAIPKTPGNPSTPLSTGSTTIGTPDTVIEDSEVTINEPVENHSFATSTRPETAASSSTVTTAAATTVASANTVSVTTVNTLPIALPTTLGIPLLTQGQANKSVILMVPPGAPGTVTNLQNQQFVWIPAIPGQQVSIPQLSVKPASEKTTGKSKKKMSPMVGSEQSAEKQESNVLSRESPSDSEKLDASKGPTSDSLNRMPDLTFTTQQFLGSASSTADTDKKSLKMNDSSQKSKNLKRGKTTKAKKQLCLEQEMTTESKDSSSKNKPTHGSAAASTEVKASDKSFTVLSIPDESNEGKTKSGSGSFSLGSDIIRSAFLLAQGDGNTIADILGTNPESKVVRLVASPMKVQKDTSDLQDNTSNFVDQFLNTDTTQVMSMFSSSKLDGGGDQPLLSLMMSPSKSQPIPDFCEFSQFTIMLSPSKGPFSSAATSLSAAISSSSVFRDPSSLTVSTSVQSNMDKITAVSSATQSSSSSTQSSRASTFTVDSILRPIPVFALSPSKASTSKKLPDFGDFSQLSLPFSPNKTETTTFSNTPASSAAQTSIITSMSEKVQTDPIPPARPIPKFVGFLSPLKGGLCAPEGDTMNISLCLEAPETSDVNTHQPVTPNKRSDILCTPAKVVLDDDDCSSSYWSGMSNASTPTSLHAADTPEKLPDTPTKTVVQIMQSVARGIVTPPRSHSRRLPPKTPSPQKFITGLSTPEKSAYSPNRLRPLIPKPMSDTPTKAVSPYLKKTKKSPRRQILQQHVRSILPKGFVLNTTVSPVKLMADNIKAKAKKLGRRRRNANVITPSTRRILPNLTKIAQDAGMATADEDDDDIDTVETSEYDTLDSEVLTDDQEKPAEKSEEGKPVKQKKKRYRKRIETKQDEDSFSDGDVESQEEGDDHISQLLKASSTVRYDPEQARKSKKKARSKACREATKQMLAPNLVEKDSLGDERDMACAQDYIDRVREALKSDISKYENFLVLLQGIAKEDRTPVQTYEEMKMILADHPDLIEDFGVFLTAEDAQKCGTFKVNDEYSRVKHFLRKVEVYYRRKPGHFQKIIKALTPYKDKTLNPTEMWKALQPLLKGQKYLLEEFQSLCLGKPAESSMFGFEEITVGSDEELEDVVDEVEEITLYEDVSDTDDGTKKCQCQCHERDDERYSSRRRHCLECGKKVIIKGDMYLQRGNKYLKPLEVYYNDKTKERRRSVDIDEDDLDDGDDIVIDDDVDDDDDDQHDGDFKDGDDDDLEDDLEDYGEDKDEDYDDDDIDDDYNDDDDDEAMSPSPDENDAEDGDFLPDGDANEAQGTAGKNETWTKEHDSYVLTVCKEVCKEVTPDEISMATFRQIAEHLKDKTAEQVKARFVMYLTMLQNDSILSDGQDASAAAAADADDMETD